MQKTFCDRCGEEINTGTRLLNAEEMEWIIAFTASRSFKGTSARATDICRRCAGEVLLGIPREKKQEQNHE